MLSLVDASHRYIYKYNIIIHICDAFKLGIPNLFYLTAHLIILKISTAHLNK
jgi:hypothetical protein